MYKNIIEYGEDVIEWEEWYPYGKTGKKYYKVLVLFMHNDQEYYFQHCHEDLDTLIKITKQRMDCSRAFLNETNQLPD